jgi:hypothetical protein
VNVSPPSRDILLLVVGFVSIIIRCRENAAVLRPLRLGTGLVVVGEDDSVGAEVVEEGPCERYEASLGCDSAVSVLPLVVSQSCLVDCRTLPGMPRVVRAVHDVRFGDWRERQRGYAAVGGLDHVVFDYCRHYLGLCCDLTSEKIRCDNIIISALADPAMTIWEGISAVGFKIALILKPPDFAPLSCL